MNDIGSLAHRQPLLLCVRRTGTSVFHVALLLRQPCLTTDEHVSVRKYFQDFCNEALCLEFVCPPELALSISCPGLYIQETELWVAAELPECLSDGELFVKE